MTKLPMKELIPKDPTVHGTQHQIGQEVVVRSISTEPIEFIATHAPLWDCEHSRPNEVRIRLTSDSLVYTHTLSLTTRSTCRAVKIFLERYCGYDYDKINIVVHGKRAEVGDIVGELLAAGEVAV